MNRSHSSQTTIHNKLSAVYRLGRWEKVENIAVWSQEHVGDHTSTIRETYNYTSTSKSHQYGNKWFKLLDCKDEGMAKDDDENCD